MFNNPSAWAIYCKKIVNPAKKSGCGWASVKYKGRKMDHFKTVWTKMKSEKEKKQLEEMREGMEKHNIAHKAEVEEEEEVRNLDHPSVSATIEFRINQISEL